MAVQAVLRRCCCAGAGAPVATYFAGLIAVVHGGRQSSANLIRINEAGGVSATIGQSGG